MNFRAAWRKLEHGPQAMVAFILDCRSIPPLSPFADAVVQHEADMTGVHSEPEKAGRCGVRLLWNCENLSPKEVQRWGFAQELTGSSLC